MALKFASEVLSCTADTAIASLHVITATAKVAEKTVPQIAASVAFSLNEAAVLAADSLYDEEAHTRLDERIAKFAGLSN